MRRRPAARGSAAFDGRDSPIGPSRALSMAEPEPPDSVEPRIVRRGLHIDRRRPMLSTFRPFLPPNQADRDRSSGRVDPRGRMPFVSIRILKEKMAERNAEKKAEISRRVTDAITEATGIPLEAVWIVFEEVEGPDWWVGARKQG